MAQQFKIIRRGGALCLLLGVALCSSPRLHAQAETLRDPLQQPFTAESIWNHPISSDAVYGPAGFGAAGNVGADIVHVLRMRDSFPERRVLDNNGFGPGRCTGTEELPFTLHVPDDWIVPDAGNSPYGGTPNSSFALIDDAGEAVLQAQVIARCEVGGPVHLPAWMQWPDNRPLVSLRGDGLAAGPGHGASGLATLGGLIRLGEFAADRPIAHAIKVNPYAHRYLHYSEAVPGYRWPATRADGYAGEDSDIAYNPAADPAIVMGTLLAIPPSVTPDSLAISSPAAQKLFAVMRDYGVYFVEDAAYDTWDLVLERDVELEFAETYGFSLESEEFRAEFNALMSALHVVTNNGPGSIGGGGTPRVAMAPPLAPADTASTSSTHLAAAASSRISVRPNPARDVVNLDCAEVAIGSSFTVVDQFGRVVQSGRLEQPSTSLDLSGQPAGIYAVLLRSNNSRTRATRIILQ